MRQVTGVLVVLAALAATAAVARAEPATGAGARWAVREVPGAVPAPRTDARLWRRQGLEAHYAGLLSAQRSDGKGDTTPQQSAFCRCCPCRSRRAWQTTVSLPVWVPGVTGDFAAGGASASTNLGGDLPGLGGGELRFAFVGGLAVRYHRWQVFFDGFGIRLGQGAEFERLGRGVDASLSAGMWRFALGYRLYECPVPSLGCLRGPSCFCLDAYAGSRLHWAKLRIAGTAGAEREARVSKTWAGPIVGLQAEWALTPRFSFVGRGDIGGFGIGSDFEWMLSVGFRWSFTKRDAIALGYSWFDTFFERGVGDERLRFGLALRGPSLIYSHRF